MSEPGALAVDREEQEESVITDEQQQQPDSSLEGEAPHDDELASPSVGVAAAAPAEASQVESEADRSSSSLEHVVDASFDDKHIVTRELRGRRAGPPPPPPPPAQEPTHARHISAIPLQFEDADEEEEEPSDPRADHVNIHAAAYSSERRPSVSILAAAEIAGDVPEAQVVLTPSNGRPSIDPSTPSVTTAPNAALNMFSPTRPVHTPLAHGSPADIFSPTRPVVTPVAANRPASSTVTPARPPRPSQVPYCRRESLLSKSHLTFKSSLKHQFHLIDQQVTGGQQSVKRVSSFLKKVCEASESHSTTLLKLTATEESRADASRHTEAMTDHLKALTQMTAAVEAIALRDQLFARRILAVVVQPLLQWLPSAEDRRSVLSKTEKSSSSTLADKNREADKIRLSGVKLWMELLALRKERESCAGDAVKLEKVTKKITKAKDATRSAFVKFESTRSDVVRRNQEWRSTVLPNLLSGMEELERERLTLLKTVLTGFATTMRESVGPEPQPLAILQTVEQQVQLLNVSVDINRFIDQTVHAHGLPPADPALVQDLPCASGDLAPDTERWESFIAPISVTPAPNSPLTARGLSGAEVSVLGAIREDRTLSGGDEFKSAPAIAASSPAGVLPQDEDEEDEEDETLSTTLPQTIRETWVVALMDHPPSSAPGGASSSASSSSSSDLPLLRFAIDDIIRVTDKVSAGEGMWIGSNVGEINGQLGRFPRAIVRSVDDKYVEPAVDPATEAARTVADVLRGTVSKKKKRFQQDGFDLDLTYILPNIIAMGFPSEGLEGQYRNHMSDVQRFFTKRHPDNYKLYNLCSERAYEASKFDGRVARFPFDDHNPCPLALVLPIMKDIHEHLHPNGVFNTSRVAAIHCKAGKGRTGFIIACYLLYSGLFPSYTPELPLRFYAVKRTKNQKGVTIPSQIRYVMYFARWLRTERLSHFPVIPPRNPVLLQSIRLLGIPASSKGRDIWFKLIAQDGKYSSKGRITPVRRLAEDDLIFQSSGSSVGIASLDQDVQVLFYTGSTFSKDTKLFGCWFNTRMLGLMDGNERDQPIVDESDDGTPRTLVLTKAELDKACKDVRNTEFTDGFKCELVFTS